MNVKKKEKEMGTNTKHKEIIIPIFWEGWDEGDMNVTIFYNVEFYEDFGIFKKGEKFNIISIDYNKGIIQSYNDEGISIIRTQFFKCVAYD